MPPKKKARTSGSNLAANTKSSASAPATVAEICEARVQLKDWILDAYQGRHGFATERNYPVGKGGSFLDIVHRCWWSTSGKAGKHIPDIIADSLSFCQKIGIVDSAVQCEDFLHKHFNNQGVPPAPGSYITTNILQWSFDPEAFWRTPDMATVLDIAKSIALVGWKEGQALGMRLAPNFESEMDDDEPILNAFLFDDGGMRGVAAALVWCGLIYFCGSLPADKVCDPQVVSLARSLLTIPTYYRQDEPDPTRAMIGRIVRQNVEAKKLAVSSFEWSQILAGMAKDGEKITVSQAVEIYNASPEVVAHGIGSGSKDKTGTGSLLLDGKKQYAIKHWLQGTCKQAKEQVLISLRDAPFAYGPWGEQLSVMSFLFLESTMDLMASPDCGLVAGASEASIPLDWSLPLGEDAQANLFYRIRTGFEKSTAIIDNPADKKRYRKSEEELQQLRNLMALWSQVRAFCSTRLSKFAEFEKAVTQGNTKDLELREILDQRPGSFCVSMLASYQKQAMEEVLAAEEGATLEVETERLKVRDARWSWFKGALERDQALVRQIGSAPDKIAALRHRKQMAWRLIQAKNGEKLVRNYMEKFLRTEFVAKAELAQQKVNEFRSQVAQTSGRPDTDICMIGIVDLNVPGAKASERINELAQCMQFLNDLAPERHACLLEMAEHAKRSSRRGISDEEREVEEALWSLRQVLDVRWVMPFNLHPSAEQQSNRRRFSMGRVVGNIDAQDSNIWMTCSELSICGRPLSGQSVQLPLSKELILPESLSAEDDLKQAERQRPSTETAAAQKGVSRWICLLESILTITGDSFKDKCVILCNFTPYVEDVGCAAFSMRLQEREFKGGFNTKNLYYLSVSWLQKDQFGAARLCREVTDAWCQKKFKHAGQEFTSDAPELSNQEIEAVPGGKASLGQLDQIKFEILERTTGDKLSIKADEHKYWNSQGGEISETYSQLRAKHLELIGQQNSIAGPEDPSTAPPVETNVEDESGDVTMESLAKLEEKHGVEQKTTSEVNNVEILRCKDSSVWLLSSQDKTLAKHTILGGYGTGQWVPDSDDSPGVPFSIPEGDKTTIQLDEVSFNPEAQGVSTMSLFKMLARAEREKGLTQHRVSFLSIERKVDGAIEAGQDGFDVKVKLPQKFKCMRDPRATDSSQEKISMKNIFAKALESTHGSQHIMHLFRYRYEKIGQNFKIQRPYVVTKRGITLKKDCPLKVSGSSSG